MKIGFSGSHNAGKTTTVWGVLSELKRKIPGININEVPEQARRCPFPIGSQSNFEAQLWMLLEQIQEEFHATKYHDIVICDRIVLDCVGYAKVVGLTQQEIKFLEDIALRWIIYHPYDLVFYGQPMKLKPQKLREPSEAFQIKAAEAIYDLIKNQPLNMKLVELSGTYEERFQRAYDEIWDLLVGDN